MSGESAESIARKAQYVGSTKHERYRIRESEHPLEPDGRLNWNDNS